MVKLCPRQVLSQSQFLLSSLDTLGLVTMSAVISLIPLLISQPSVHPLLVLWPQGFPGRFVGASLWRCALGTPVLSLLARQSPYLLVTGSSKSACLADPAFSRSPEHRRRNILKLPPWPHLSGFKHKSARRPATSALSPFSYLFHIYVTKMKSKSNPASGVFQRVTKKPCFWASQCL